MRYWGGRGTNARYLCKGDYDDGGQYCIGFGGASVDRLLGQELLKVISQFGVEASLRAMEELSAGDAAQRAARSSQLEQLEYEAKKAFEQYDAVDARNRLAAAELRRARTGGVAFGRPGIKGTYRGASDDPNGSSPRAKTCEKDEGSHGLSAGLVSLEHARFRGCRTHSPKGVLQTRSPGRAQAG